MTRTITLFLLAALLAATGCAEVMQALEGLEATDGSTPTDGLREALQIGSGRAVDSLSQIDGYLQGEFRIEVPEDLEPVVKALDTLGQDDLVDEFVTSMNRAAEAAAPIARDIFVDSIRGMTFDDAMAILRGDSHEATDYFRGQAGPRLTEAFRPIVDDKLAAVGATKKFNDMMGQLQRLPFVSKPVVDLGGYVTSMALDGLFGTLEREEELIREDPAARTTELLKRWFGS